MKPKNIATYVFKERRSYPVKEIMDARGPDAFAAKMGDFNQNRAIIDALQKSPPIEPFTEEEWADLLIQMVNDK